jgi:hypothetical protein
VDVAKVASQNGADITQEMCFIMIFFSQRFYDKIITDESDKNVMFLDKLKKIGILMKGKLVRAKFVL